jgi:C4-dicarboxylate-specific signal transduction histidine kinase
VDETLKQRTSGMQKDNNRKESVSQLQVLSNNCPPRQQLNEELEARVEERTAELNRVVVQLKKEVRINRLSGMDY